ncbi:Hypothetical_protein [Hexamita inflata]|uniref:Hypothetical_protein n=1 Tax=Hexamita inflata TaxID=28002 RepID=A0AA86Q198_9EUKA|nr:Hypothetical protein HINF_LOCUS37820 [Hexamita inflata]
MGNICQESNNEEFWGEEYQENVYTNNKVTFESIITEPQKLKFTFNESTSVESGLSDDDYVLEPFEMNLVQISSSDSLVYKTEQDSQQLKTEASVITKDCDTDNSIVLDADLCISF